MVVLSGTRTGRTAICVCGLVLAEWDFGTKSPSWLHETVEAKPDLCPGWREATPRENSIREPTP
jgi:hypothetical protein